MTKELAVKNEIMNSTMVSRFAEFLDVAPVTVRTYVSGVKAFAKFLAAQNVARPMRNDVVAFRRSLENSGRKPATIALYLSSLRRFFSWTENEKLYTNITAGVKAPKQSRGHKKDALAGYQVKEMLQSINKSSVEGLRNYAILSLMTCGGLRTVEITRAKLEDFRSVGGVPVLFIQGKGRTDKDEFVKLPRQVEQAIRSYLSAKGMTAISEPLFTSESDRNHGHGLTTRTISGIAKRAMISAGFNSSRLTAHSLRHTAITLALMGGQSLTDVQAFARHSNINTTMIYNHSVNRMRSACENTIAKEIF